MTDEQHLRWMEQSLEVICNVLAVNKENIFLKLRQRKPGRLGQYQKYEKRQHEFEVEENGLKFIVYLSDYLDTGLFTDHRTRQKVKEQCAGKKVLNLVAYTGSFSVFTAAGGAAEVVMVDLSKTYLAWAEKNMHLNIFSDNEKYKYIHADVLQYLKIVPADYFDIVILDPPTFSNSKRMDDFLDIQRDHVTLINDCLHAMRSGGKLFFSNNSRKFVLNKEKIRAAIMDGITKATTAFDFKGKLFRWCYQIIK